MASNTKVDAILVVGNGDVSASNPVPVSGTIAMSAGTVLISQAAGANHVEPIDSGGTTMTETTGHSLKVTPLATEAHLGEVGGKTAIISVTPTLTVHASYAANDYVGTSGTAMTFTGAARVAAGGGAVISATLIDYAAQSVAAELWLFDAQPTPPADSAAWSISDDDALKCIGVIPFTTYYASALNSVSPVNGLSIGYKLASGTSLYGCLVTRGAPAYADGDVSVRLTVLQD